MRQSHRIFYTQNFSVQTTNNNNNFNAQINLSKNSKRYRNRFELNSNYQLTWSISRTLNASVVVNIGDSRILYGRNSPSGRIVVVKMRRFSHARRRGHHSDRFVIMQPAAASATLYDGHKTAPEFLIEERVQNGIDAGVGGAQPLCDRRGNRQNIVLPGLDLAAQLDPGEDHVQRQPGDDKEDDNRDEHLDHFHLALLLHSLHLRIFGVSWYVTFPHLDPD